MMDQSIAELEKALSSESSGVNLIGRNENHRVIIKREKLEEEESLKDRRPKKSLLESVLGDKSDVLASLEARSKFRSSTFLVYICDSQGIRSSSNTASELENMKEKEEKEWLGKVPDVEEDSKSDPTSKISKLLSILELMKQLEKK